MVSLFHLQIKRSPARSVLSSEQHLVTSDFDGFHAKHPLFNS